jgi:SAM-dependent methyltransferase
MRSDAEYWDTSAQTWKQTGRHMLWRAHSDAVNRALFAGWLPEERVERLLKTDLFDEACSDGLFPLLLSRAQTLIGMDLSVVVVHAAMSNHTSLQATGGNVRCLPFADGVFGAVVSNSTLDHFESLDEMVASLRELRRVLRTGGQLLLTLDNPANPVIALRNALPFPMLHRLGLVPYYVGATCGPEQLRHILEQLDFDVLEVKAVMHCPRVLAVAAAVVLERRAGPETQRRFLRFLTAFERLANWPTQFLTGYFVAVKAIKR